MSSALLSVRSCQQWCYLLCWPMFNLFPWMSPFVGNIKIWREVFQFLNPCMCAWSENGLTCFQLHWGELGEDLRSIAELWRLSRLHNNWWWLSQTCLSLSETEMIKNLDIFAIHRASGCWRQRSCRHRHRCHLQQWLLLPYFTALCSEVGHDGDGERWTRASLKKCGLSHKDLNPILWWTMATDDITKGWLWRASYN